jgi:hypothetical protein
MAKVARTHERRHRTKKIITRAAVKIQLKFEEGEFIRSSKTAPVIKRRQCKLTYNPVGFEVYAGKRSSPVNCVYVRLKTWISAGLGSMQQKPSYPT